MKRLMMCVVMLSLLLLSVMPVLAQPQTSCGSVHVVKPGETLFSIARWYGMDVWTVARANGIVNPNYIYVGQRIKIPCGGAPAPQPGGVVHVVQPGEILYNIAARYGVTAWAIAQANGLHNINHIYVGQRLVIPGAAKPAPAPAPAPSQPSKPRTSQPSTSGAWRGEYFAGREPAGGPLLVRDDRAINFHWGLSSPDPRVPPDEFSVKWTRNINFAGGLYRFTIVVSDGVRLWIDGQVVLDAWKAQPETTYTVDVCLPRGVHSVAIDYFDEADTATIQFSFKRLDNVPLGSCSLPQDSSDSDSGANGDGSAPEGVWLGQYYDNENVAGAPVATRMDGAVGFEWGTEAPIAGVPADNFSVRWTQRVAFKQDNYVFCTMADDGARIFLDGTVILDAWHASDASENTCTEVSIDKAGKYDVEVHYYEHGGKALIYVWWERH